VPTRSARPTTEIEDLAGLGVRVGQVGAEPKINATAMLRLADALAAGASALSTLPLASLSVRRGSILPFRHREREDVEPFAIEDLSLGGRTIGDPAREVEET
jgi:hypothetical protein